MVSTYLCLTEFTATSALTDLVSKPLAWGSSFQSYVLPVIPRDGINALGINALSALANFLLKLPSEQSPTEHHTTIWALTWCFSFHSCIPSKSGALSSELEPSPCFRSPNGCSCFRSLHLCTHRSFCFVNFSLCFVALVELLLQT